MKPPRIVTRLTLMMFLLLLALHLQAAEEPMDLNRARELIQKFRGGEKLSADEQAYLDRARRFRAEAARQQQTAVSTNLHFTPLTELLGAKYQGQDGGLYGGGRNAPPPAHLAAALQEAARVQPLDAQGKPSPSGKTVLLALGMSNTTQEFSRFQPLAGQDAEKSPALVIVDGAQGGQDAIRTAEEAAEYWRKVDERLQAAEVTPLQVQVVWLKQAMIMPTRGFPAETKRLQELLGKIVAIAKKRYPNLRLVYLSSRIYAGYAVTRLNPEPYAYESAFAVRGLILDQVQGNPELNFDAARGPVKAPLLLWGPYLWADGLTPRKSDGLTWKREDLSGDGTHPSPSGRQKVAEQLLKFFKMDATARAWF